jgi:hypothetical protein
MKYRVTRRGWIVFSTLALLLVLLVYNIIISMTDKNSVDSNLSNDIPVILEDVDDEINCLPGYDDVLSGYTDTVTEAIK